jgi:hypothetical protein
MLSIALMVPAAVLCGSLALGGSACLIPPQLEVADEDAGANSPPVILSSGPAPEFSFPGPLLLDRNDERRLNLTIDDNDLDDVVYVRLFIDYNKPDPTNFASNCSAPASGDVSRIADCALTNVCFGIAADDQDEHFFEAIVADREFLDESDPLAEDQPSFRAVPADARQSSAAWTVRCNPPQ